MTTLLDRTTHAVVSDPSAPAVVVDSAPTFASLGLPAPLVAALLKAGIASPFPIQAETIPDALAGNDLLGRGSTGSGKTLAFGLPLIARIAGMPAQPKHPRAVILVPTRELAMQVNDALEPLGRSLGLHFKTVVGGTSMEKQIYALRRGVDVLVATPGRIADLIRQGECILDDVEIVVLDEADQMCDMGFLPEVTALLELCSPAAQTLLFSATLDGDVDTIVREHMHEPVRHELDAETSPVDTMEHHVLVVNREDKAVVATEIARRDGRTIMFVRSQLGAERVAGNIADRGVNARALHGGMSAERPHAHDGGVQGGAASTSSSPPTSPPAASTSTTSRWSSTSTRRRTPRPTCTVPAVRRAPVPRVAWSPSCCATSARACSACTRRPASPPRSTRSSPARSKLAELTGSRTAREARQA